MPSYYSFLDNGLPKPPTPNRGRTGKVVPKPAPRTRRKPKPSASVPAQKAPAFRKYPEGYVKPSRTASTSKRVPAARRKMK
jgi:hypothetical protein